MRGLDGSSWRTLGGPRQFVALWAGPTDSGLTNADFADLRHVVPDLAKLKRTISYRPQFTLDAAIAEAIEWQRQQ